MQFVFIFILSSFILFPVFSKADSAKAQLKVLTLNFNSENVPNDGNYFVRDLRFQAIQDWVKANDPDVILFQEAWNYRNGKNITQAVADAIGYDVTYHLEMGFFGVFNEGTGILAKKKFKMKDTFALKLPHSAPDAGDGKSWVIELGAVTYVVGATLTTPSGESLFVYSTHLAGQSASDRADQAAAIVADLKARSDAAGIPWAKTQAIVGGDYNSVPTDAAVINMLQVGFLDSFNEVHPADSSCSLCESPELGWFNPFTIAPGMIPSQAAERGLYRYDYIFSHGASMVPAGSTLTFTAPFKGVWMSDHFGVTTRFGGDVRSPASSVTHDSQDIPSAVVETIDDDTMTCIRYGCVSTLKDMIVQGSRGIVFENNSSEGVMIEVDGPGYIFSKPKTTLYPGERASFTFSQKGRFTYYLQPATNNSDGTDLLSGSIQVLNSGY